MTAFIAGLALLFGAPSLAPTSTPASAPPKPVLSSAGGGRLKMARGSYCWNKPPVGLCVDTKPPTTKRALKVRDGEKLRLDMRIRADLLNASIRGGPQRLSVRRVRGSKRRFVIRLPIQANRRPVLELVARYAQGDGVWRPPASSPAGRLR